jgi:hypothetical protein
MSVSRSRHAGSIPAAIRVRGDGAREQRERSRPRRFLMKPFLTFVPPSNLIDQHQAVEVVQCAEFFGGKPIYPASVCEPLDAVRKDHGRHGTYPLRGGLGGHPVPSSGRQAVRLRRPHRLAPALLTGECPDALVE